MTVLLGSDHAGFGLRRVLANSLIERGHAVAEMGATGEDAFDYPDAAIELSRRMQRGDAEFGVLICGTGIGMAITANKFGRIRAAVCWSTEAAKLAREHNHANVLCVGARLIDPDTAQSILDVFLATPESPESRHVRRVAKMDSLGECSEPAAAAK
ncbi:MAG: ribose 5-phosphate isomerase B [Fimbriimonadales bacterium]